MYMPHTLLYGAPGSGKTTLCSVLANELKLVYNEDIRLNCFTPLHLRSGQVIMETVLSLRDKDILFIDEIHALPPDVEESLYSVMQDQYITDEYGQRLDTPHITIMGATTRLSDLSKPLIDRFPLAIKLKPLSHNNLRDAIFGSGRPQFFEEYHGQEEAKAILLMHASTIFKKSVTISSEVADTICSRALGNPRIALQFTRHVSALGKLLERPVTIEESLAIFNILGVDENGLHDEDRAIIRALISRDNKPMGMNALASFAGVTRGDLEIIIEPRLDLCGFLLRTPRGRTLTDKCLQIYKNA